MHRSLSLITPTGHLTLGNLLGALRGMVAAQEAGDCFFGISDLHAMTTPHDPATLREAITEVATLFLAAGLDPGRATLFRQSQVPAHRELTYLLECTAYTGELNRMIQFKEKGRGVASTRASLYTYPVLMAADILLYRPSSVPVGDDQRQHVELTRDLAIRFNQHLATPFCLRREQQCLLSQLLALRFEQQLIALRFKQPIHVEVLALGRRPLQLAHL